MEPFVVSKYQQVPLDKLVPGLKVHLQGHDIGKVWVVVEVDGDKVHLETPKTKYKKTVNAVYCCYVRKDWDEWLLKSGNACR